MGRERDGERRGGTRRRAVAALTVAGLVTAGGACGDEAGSGGAAATTTTAVPVIDPGDGGRYDPDIRPSDFVASIDNPYLPLVPGTRWTYEGESDGEHERVEVEVLAETREVMGITATVVHDTVYVDGELAEDTFDWFAQDVDGNVWYLGEDTHEYEGGEPVNAAGAWEAGVDGARPGIIMPAAPAVGDAYRQEYLPGEAEDMGEVLEVGVARRIGFGAYDDVLVTEEWTPLEPETVEAKWYARGIGLIREATTAGGSGSLELVEHTAPR